MFEACMCAMVEYGMPLLSLLLSLVACYCLCAWQQRRVHLCDAQSLANHHSSLDVSIRCLALTDNFCRLL